MISHCALHCLVHCALTSPEWAEEKLHWVVYCALETGPWCEQPGRSAAHCRSLPCPAGSMFNVSDSDKVLGNRLPSAAQCPGQPSLRAKSENVKLNDKIDRILCAQTAQIQLNVVQMMAEHHLELLNIFKILQNSEIKASLSSFRSCFGMVLSTFIFL